MTMLLAAPAGMCGCPAPEPVIANVFNEANLGRSVLRPAENGASWLLSSLCVAIRWSHCTEPTASTRAQCDVPGGSIEIHLLPSPLGAAGEDALGLALVPWQHTAAYLSRIRETAARNSTAIDVPILLGYVMAHEIGHVLLGSNAHASSGVMAGNFTRRDLKAASQRRLRFTAGDRNAARARHLAVLQRQPRVREP